MAATIPDPPIPMPFRVADQHQVALVHPPLALTEPLAPSRLVAFALAAAHGSLELPDGDRAQSDLTAEEDDLRIWTWPSRDRLQLMIDHLDERPALHQLERGRDRRRLTVAGAPMLVELLDHANPPLFVAHVRGYVRERVRLHAVAWTTTPAFRLRLLAAVQSLTLRMADEVSSD